MEREKPSYFAIIPANVRYDKNLKDKAKLLYGEITSLCNKDGYCWAKNEYFADLYDVTKTTVSTLIKNLIDCGYIKSKIIYKEGTKEILNRYLSIVNDPIKENLKDNNINIINKKEEEKEKIINFYNNNFGLITPYIAENIFTYLEDGLQGELIIKAMEESIANNVRRWNYVKTILNDCINNNIKTAEQYDAKQREYKNKKTNKEINTTKKQEVTYNTDFSEYDQYVKRD